MSAYSHSEFLTQIKPTWLPAAYAEIAADVEAEAVSS